MSIFTEEDRSIVENPADLVGEDKKYKTVDDALKALAHSQVYIKKLEGEQEEARAQIAAQDKLEEMLAQLRQPASVPQAQTPLVVDTPPAATIDVAERVREELTKITDQQRITSNVNEVSNRMVEALGSQDKAKQYIDQKALELGVSSTFLADVAAKSPKAFFETIGLPQKPVSSPGASRSDVNPVSFAGTNTVKPGTYAFYQDLLASDRKAYFSPKIQQQMMKEALEKGDAFFA